MSSLWFRKVKDMFGKDFVIVGKDSLVTPLLVMDEFDLKELEAEFKRQSE
jgi:hypothetical protein